MEQEIHVDPSGCLYHYTDVTGLLGIVVNRRLWATVAHYMNDSTELQLAFQYARNFARSVAPSQTRDIGEGLASFCEGLEDAGSGGVRTGLCVASLSEEPDLLSQWRAYGSYALGFDPETLRGVSPGWRLEKCLYGEAEQVAIVEIAVNEAVLEHQKEVAQGGVSMELGKRIYSSVLSVAPRIKHAAFREEKEWRLFGFPDETLAPLAARPGQGCVTPFANIRLEPTFNGQPLVRDLIVGPSRPDAFERASFLHQAAKEMMRHAAVRPSTTPLV